jgi:hypothetical protein
LPVDVDGGDLPDLECNIPAEITLMGQPDAGAPRIVDDLDAGQVPLVACGTGQAWNLDVQGFAYGFVTQNHFNLRSVSVSGAQKDGLLLLGGGHDDLQTVIVSDCGRSGIHIQKTWGDDTMESVTAERNEIGILVDSAMFSPNSVEIRNNRRAGLKFVWGGAAYLGSSDFVIEDNGTPASPAPGILIEGAGQIHLPGSANSRVINNSGNGVEISGAFSSADVSFEISGNLNGVSFASDAGAQRLNVATRVTGNLGAGVLFLGPLDAGVTGVVAGNGTNVVADPSFQGVLHLDALKLDAAADGGAFVDADSTGHELKPWSYLGTLYIDDGGATVAPFDGSAGAGPFNYKLLSDAGTIFF